MNAEITRRQFVRGAGAAGLGLVAGCGRLPWQAPEPARIVRVGYLLNRPPESATLPEPGTEATFDALREGLREYGYIEGQNLSIEYRATLEGERLREYAAELVRLPVNVIIASPPAAVAARQVTETIPIVLAGGGDPVAVGLVESLARPGGNVTGIPAEVRGGLQGKRLELLKLAAPGLSRVGVLQAV